jgi:hypothetical protein
MSKGTYGLRGLKNANAIKYYKCPFCVGGTIRNVESESEGRGFLDHHPKPCRSFSRLDHQAILASLVLSENPQYSVVTLGKRVFSKGFHSYGKFTEDGLGTVLCDHAVGFGSSFEEWSELGKTVLEKYRKDHETEPKIWLSDGRVKTKGFPA